MAGAFGDGHGGRAHRPHRLDGRRHEPRVGVDRRMRVELHEVGLQHDAGTVDIGADGGEAFVHGARQIAVVRGACHDRDVRRSGRRERGLVPHRRAALATQLDTDDRGAGERGRGDRGPAEELAARERVSTHAASQGPEAPSPKTTQAAVTVSTAPCSVASRNAVATAGNSGLPCSRSAHALTARLSSPADSDRQSLSRAGDAAFREGRLPVAEAEQRDSGRLHVRREIDPERGAASVVPSAACALALSEERECVGDPIGRRRPERTEREQPPRRGFGPAVGTLRPRPAERVHVRDRPRCGPDRRRRDRAPAREGDPGRAPAHRARSHRGSRFPRVARDCRRRPDRPGAIAGQRRRRRQARRATWLPVPTARRRRARSPRRRCAGSTGAVVWLRSSAIPAIIGADASPVSVVDQFRTTASVED